MQGGLPAWLLKNYTSVKLRSFQDESKYIYDFTENVSTPLCHKFLH